MRTHSAVVLTLGMVCMPVAGMWAAPPAGYDPNSPTHRWFEAQYSRGGQWCCNVADGHLLEDSDWRLIGDHYEVKLFGVWRSISADALRDPKGGPNPTGHAIVWYLVTEFGLHIYCFAPGFEY